MDPNDINLYKKTLVSTWQLPRRFDAVIWFARWQHFNPDWIKNVRFNIPMMGPSTIEVDITPLENEAVNTPDVSQLGRSGEIWLSTQETSWFAHECYLESLQQWLTRHAHFSVSTASITWILSLHRDAWLALAGTRIQHADTSPYVKSAFLVLALGSLDIELLAALPKDTFMEIHSQIYANELNSGLTWLSTYHPGKVDAWLNAITSQSFFKTIWSRISEDDRLRILTSASPTIQAKIRSIDTP